jgi:hypothetical protein
MKDENQRKVKYDLLRESGFTSVEANRLKDYSWDKVNYFVDMNMKYRTWLNEELNRKGKQRGKDSK